MDRYTANRVTLAIATLGPVFTRKELEITARVAGGSATAPLRGMVRLGLLEDATGPRGLKTWRKTAAYHPPSGGKTLATREAQQFRLAAQTAAVGTLDACLVGWSATPWPPHGYSAEDMA